MKKNLIMIITFIITILIVVGCVFAYMYFTKSWIFEEKVVVKPVEQISKEALYTAESFPKVDASTATQPLMMGFVNNFTASEVDKAKMKFTVTHDAYVKLIKDKVDLIIVTEPSKDELALAAKAGIELEVIPVVKEGFVFFANKSNPVSNLTTEQIQDIYQGKITNWSKVGGSNLKIKAFQRVVNSGSQTGMLSLVMKGKKLMSAPKENITQDMSSIVNLVSSYDNGQGAIGYSYYYYATTMFETIDANVAGNIKLLSVDGILPNNETIKTGTYPFNTAYYIVINKADAVDAPSRKLANLMLSVRGQNVAQEVGYVPAK